MIDKLISFSINNKLIIGLFVLGLIGWGIYSFKQIPIDAVPDITTNQVQIITQSPTLAAQEVEQFVTFPLEIAMSNLPDVEEIRSISRIGISVITVVFEEDADIFRSRQLISEQIKIAEGEIPKGFGSPELGPITSGLGEVFQYVLHTLPGYDSIYSDMDLRTINDWIVKRQLAGTPGIIEVSGWGGHKKQYEVAVNPEKLNSMNISIADIYQALENNNENTGGSYIEKQYNTYFIRGEGLVKSIEDIEKIVVKTVDGIPILIRNVAKVGYGSSPRYGAITWNGHGEVVGGQTLMLKGENSYEVVAEVKKRIEVVRKSLPEGIVLESYLDRSELIDRAMGTVTKNLIEGGLIVILILVLLLGNFRGGLIVASVIPLAMLFAMGMMNMFGVSANLMSLGAIDFGLVVDGSVIIVEAILLRLTTKYTGRQLSQEKMDDQVNHAATQIRSSAAFGEIIILIVYLPILALVGIEGKMFGPMAKTVSFAILGALILSMTYVPMMSALFLNKKISDKRTFSDRFIGKLQQWYKPILTLALNRKWITIVIAFVLFGLSLFTFNRLGGEFIPTLEEGDFALHQILPPGSSLQQSVDVSKKIQRTLLEEFPEVETVVSKIGTAEIPTDPMPIEVGDIIVRMRPKSEWVTASSKEEMFEKMAESLSKIPGVEYEFTQPIQMRFNELIAGVREDIAIKIFGENVDILHQKAQEAEKIINSIQGVGDLRVEQTKGLPQIIIRYERDKIAQYGLNIRELNTVLRTAFAGEVAGVVFEEERRFDLTVRLEKEYRQDISQIRNLYVPLPNGQQIPLSEVAHIAYEDGPMQISRDDAKRRIVIGVNARNRDTESLVDEISEQLDARLNLPPGYYLDYGGQFENLIAAKKRLSVAVPVALLLIFVLLFFTFGSIKQALLIFTAIPLSAIGGIYALWLRDMPFSISAGVGFIALFGVAVLNGIVLISYFNQLKKEGVSNIKERIMNGTKIRLRPVIMTATVAALGFLPMALSSSAGAEVQRPLATVVIGGLITATLLTLLVLPVLYSLVERSKSNGKSIVSGFLILISIGGLSNQIQAQESKETLTPITLDKAVELALNNHPSIRAATLRVEQQEELKKTAFDLEKTRISYSMGQLNSSVNDYQWEISQGFKFPTTYIAQSNLLKEKIILSEKELLISSLELERNVRSAWNQLAYGVELLKDSEKRLVTYENFALVAEKRYDAGSTNFLEKTSALSQYQQMQLRHQQLEADVIIYKQELQQWLIHEGDIILPENAFSKTAIIIEKTSTVDQNPILNYYQQKTAINEKVLKLEKSNYLPDFSVGYFNQQIDGSTGFDGLRVGIGIPLFFWTQRGKVQAARIGNDIAIADLENKTQTINFSYNTQVQKLTKHLLQVNWYQTQGLATAEEMLRFATKSYRAGAIDYMEYINTINQATEIKIAYLEEVNKYNQAAIVLQYLSGNFNN